MPPLDNAPAPAADPAATAPAPAAWYAGAEPELVGHLQNRGWDKLTAAEVALKAAQAHREAEKHIGVPADKILRMPDPTDAAATKAFWSKLGAAADKTGYDFSTVKVGDATVPAHISEALAEAAAAAYIPVNAAKEIAAALTTAEAKRAASIAEQEAQTLAANRDALAKSWGNSVDSNTFVAKQAAAKLGIGPETVAALEKVQGYAATMEMFRKVGEQMGEARFIQNTLPGGEQVPFTREAAQARIAELKSDSTWTAKYLAGDKTAMNQLQRLIEQVQGGRFADVRAA